MAEEANVSKRIRVMAKAAKRSLLRGIVNIDPPLLPLSALAAFIAASLGTYAALNAEEAKADKPRAIASTEERSRFCIRNETDTIVQYDISWGSEPQTEALGPGMRATHDGPAIVSPFVEFASAVGSPEEVRKVKLTKASDCSSGGYSFRYAQSSGSMALARQGGYYLFGAGISPKQYIDKPDPILASVAEAYADWHSARFIEPYTDAAYLPEDAAAYYDDVTADPQVPGPDPLDLAERETGDMPADRKEGVAVDNEAAAPAEVTVIRGIAGAQESTTYPVSNASNGPEITLDSSLAETPGG